MERALEAAVAAEVEVRRPPETDAGGMRGSLQAQPQPRLEPVKSRPPTLVEQMSKLEAIERELATRLRKEGVEAQIQVEMRVGEANIRFTRQLSEMTAELTRKRDDEIRAATEEYHAKVDELTGLLRRRP
jgi:hypothetical protein